MVMAESLTSARNIDSVIQPRDSSPDSFPQVVTVDLNQIIPTMGGWNVIVPTPPWDFGFLLMEVLLLR